MTKLELKNHLSYQNPGQLKMDIKDNQQIHISS